MGMAYAQGPALHVSGARACPWQARARWAMISGIAVAGQNMVDRVRVRL